ncbi:MAG: efflux RND transporter permease subunit [Candidatus Aminicenantes bacterium]|nr:efflux RND transporter permease subunit [Candidatus Aminicenantes bacterium]
MKIADISIKQPVFITMIILSLVVVGALSYNRLGVDLMPDISLPYVAVTVADPGVGPEEMEAQVTKPIEDTLSTLNGIDKITSTSSEGVSVVLAAFVLEKNTQVAATEVREKVAAIRNTLPREIIEPVINKFDPSAVPIVSYYLWSKSGRMSLPDVRQLVDDTIKVRIQQVDGVGAVDLIGGREREIQVEVNLDRLNAQGIPISQVSQAIRGENLNLPAGRVKGQAQDFLIRTKAEFTDLDEMLNIVVANVGGEPVYLKDVAAVKDDFKTQRTISRINGREAVSLIVQKQSGTNTVKVADEVYRVVEDLRRAYPDLDIHKATDASVQIKNSRDDVINTLILGVLFAGLVVLFSFGDLRNTLITVAGLPVCLIASFAVMSLFGYTVNVITLLALSLSVGLLIDDAIVVRENIFRHMDKLGQDPMKAASDGTAEVGLAVTATTLTLVAVFLPVSFTTGIAGKFFRQFGITVAAAVLISLFEAFTFAPMLSAHFFKKTERTDKKTLSSRLDRLVSGIYEKLGGQYRPLLRWALTHRKTMIALTTAVFLLSVYLFTVVGTGGTPRGEQNEFNLSVQTASGSSLDRTDVAIREIEQVLKAQPEIGDIIVVVGSTDGSTDVATINVKLKISSKEAQAYRDKLRPLLAGIPGAQITFQDASSLGGAAFAAMQTMPIQINLKCANLSDLYAAADLTKAALRGVGGLADVNSDNRPPKPELQIRIDRQRASRLGTSTAQIAAVMRTVVDGDLASKYRESERLIDIRVQASEDVRNDVGRLGRVFIPLPRGGAITLDQVASLQAVNGPTQIRRANRARQIMIGANILKGRALNEITQSVKETLDKIPFAKGVTYEFGGQVETNRKMFSSLGTAMILAIIFVYMVLASQFGSFIQPFVIMLALPLSIIGAVLGLLLANKLFDMVAFIGLIMLMGLVTKNAILLVDYTNVLRRRGMKRFEAILEAGATRLRPILMTTLAMILGMIPVAAGFGTSSSFRAAIGYTIIGGLISSTVLTLVVVPVVYSLLDDLSRKFSRKTKPAGGETP